MVADLTLSKPGAAGLNALVEADRLVVKIGSSLLVRGGTLRTGWMESIAAELARLAENGTKGIVVSSGAIALGAAKLGLAKGGRASLADAQAAAAVGQVQLAAAWSDALAGVGLTGAQILVTLGDLEDRRRYLNAATTLSRLLDHGVVPVLNENDSVATEEIRFGDNDRLAARVAQAAGADAVLLLSDVAGLYDGDPDDPASSLIPVVDGVTDALLASVDDRSSSGMGSGGMVSKLEAARIATGSGIALGIIDGRPDAPIETALRTGTGTLFLAQQGRGARKGWLGGRLTAQGDVWVDSGCIAALRDGASLLAAGIVRIEGEFARGDLLHVRDAGGAAVGKGLAEYASADLRKIAGRRQEEQADLLGHAPRAAVIHRNHMVLS